MSPNAEPLEATLDKLRVEQLKEVVRKIKDLNIRDTHVFLRLNKRKPDHIDQIRQCYHIAITHGLSQERLQIEKIIQDAYRYPLKDKLTPSTQSSSNPTTPGTPALRNAPPGATPATELSQISSAPHSARQSLANVLRHHHQANGITPVQSASTPLPAPLMHSRKTPSPTLRPSPMPTITGAKSFNAPQIVQTGAHRGGAKSQRPVPYQNLRFEPSPFYRVDAYVTNPTKCRESVSRQTTAQLHYSVTEAQKVMLETQRPTENWDTRVGLFLYSTSCKEASLSSTSTSYGAKLVFPRLISVRVNGNMVDRRVIDKYASRTNKHPQPLDLTSLFDKRYSSHRVELTYISPVELVVTVAFVKQISVEFLVSSLQQNSTVNKEEVLSRFKRKHADDDIVATGRLMSLKCPLSYTRIKDPCRSTRCDHIQCFDAMSYLQVNEQVPTWKCPICNIAAPYTDLMIDGFFLDIIRSVPDSIEQIYVEEDLSWKLPSTEEAVLIKDDVEPQVGSTPPENRPDSSTPSKRPLSPMGSGSQSKRTRVEVIDLTLSDSEPDTPTRAPPAGITDDADDMVFYGDSQASTLTAPTDNHPTVTSQALSQNSSPTAPPIKQSPPTSCPVNDTAELNQASVNSTPQLPTAPSTGGNPIPVYNPESSPGYPSREALLQMNHNRPTYNNFPMSPQSTSSGIIRLSSLPSVAPHSRSRPYSPAYPTSFPPRNPNFPLPSFASMSSNLHFQRPTTVPTTRRLSNPPHSLGSTGYNSTGQQQRPRPWRITTTPPNHPRGFPLRSTYHSSPYGGPPTR
ncbi:E3 SUMO-protein ligase pli1 [Dispira parvispora]|uniref:E3 SUMO-protein ligase pli1 n=1 Tax=Dispira parvispora TaxID=1520584 RepID=A0A9W8E8Q6_9FUNG|nr:E3 SUMO-protein ligase pli1 [Dispira parvispora]